jgi:DNA polymerase-3 subunit delta
VLRPVDQKRPLSQDTLPRCYLFYGSDEAGSRALAAKFIASLGSATERREVQPSHIKAEPSLLLDEVAARSLFGAARCVYLDGVGEECLPAIELVLGASIAGDPVILIAGALKKESRLLQCLARSGHARTTVSHALDGHDFQRLAIQIGLAKGLRIEEDLARTLVDATAGDRAILERELEKLALYADASAGQPQAATELLWGEVSASNSDVDVDAIVDALCSGSARDLEAGLSRLANHDAELIPLVRALLRRLMIMVTIRVEVERGTPLRSAIERAGRSLFWKDRSKVAQDLRCWSSGRLDAALTRFSKVERELKSGQGAGAVLLHQAITTTTQVNVRTDVDS